MDPLSFALNVLAALGLGLALGLERQYRGHPAGLRTNALVCVGAALFVSLTSLMGDGDSKTRIASYIVSGIGFLGGGVILREGLTVRGMNTAATLWCSAAVGTLAGAGFPLHALIGTVIVLATHLGLRPVGQWIDARIKLGASTELTYRLRVVCSEAQQGLVRTILLRHINSSAKMTVQGILSHEADQQGRATVVVDIFAVTPSEKALDDLVRRLDLEPDVAEVSWQRVSGGAG